MSKFVYFTRHGECEANVKGVIAGGGDDSPLTEIGKKQAEETAAGLTNVDFDFIISSPMSRTIDSAEIIVKILGYESNEIIKLPEFTERDVGEFAGRPKEEYFAFEKDGGEAGETTTEMQDRVRKGLEWLKSKEFNTALVVTHNGTVRMIRTILDNLPAKEFTNIPQLQNGEFYKVDLDKYEI